MNQNTNNSFTSAPQGGDYSDIIIPNAYATKPQNKNLKKYIVFGLVGLLFVFLLSFLFKKTVIDSKNMSKEELTTFYESDDMEKINNLEKLFFNTYNNNLTFEMVFDESKSQSIKESKGSLEKLKNLLTVKKNFDGNEASRKIFSELKKKLDERYGPYTKAIAVYEDFYQAFQSNNIDPISKYSSADNISYKTLYENFAELISYNKPLDESIDNDVCYFDGSDMLGGDNCEEQSKQVENAIKNIENNSLKKVFSSVYSLPGYKNQNNISEYISKCIAGVR
ncbi:hypothetical protein EUA79_02530 [TM7 phylum sp. oral taxon 351]|nr:hypothetical protein EUA79_02530 [TM7 phylum sp. oral taxon 351]